MGGVLGKGGPWNLRSFAAGLSCACRWRPPLSPAWSLGHPVPFCTWRPLSFPRPPPRQGAPASLPPSLLRLLSRGFTHFHPKPTSNFLTLVGNPQQRGLGFLRPDFQVRSHSRSRGWDAAFWAHSSPHTEGRLCVLPPLRSAQTRFGARSPRGRGGPPGGAATRGRCCPGLSCSRPPGEDPGEPSVCGAVGDPSSSVFRGGSAFLRPLRSAARWGLPAAALVSMSRLCLFGGAGRSGWGHCKWACRGHGVPGAELREGGGGDHRAKGAAACGALRAST